MRNQFMTAMFIISCFIVIGKSHSNPILQDKERILLDPRGGGPPPGNGFETAPVKEICDAIAQELKSKNGRTKTS